MGELDSTELSEISNKKVEQRRHSIGERARVWVTNLRSKLYQPVDRISEGPPSSTITASFATNTVRKEEDATAAKIALNAGLEGICEHMKSYNRGWKINPSDVADFYILESLLFRPNEFQPDDGENMLLVRARTRINQIGTQLSIAALRVVLRESAEYGNLNDRSDDYSRRFQKLLPDLEQGILNRLTPSYLEYATREYQNILEKSHTDPSIFERENIDPDKLTQNLERYRAYQMEIASKTGLENEDFLTDIATNAVRYHLRKYKQTFEDIDEGRAGISDLLKDRAELHDVFSILGSDSNHGSWMRTAQLAKAILFPEDPTDLLPLDIAPGRISLLLIDQLINQSHYLGRLSEHISNDFPEMSLVLTLHGLSGDSLKFLWPHASTALRGELRGRSRGLLGDHSIPSDIEEFSDDDRAQLFKCMEEYIPEHAPPKPYYLLGIAASTQDNQVRDKAVALLNTLRDRWGVINGLHKVYADLRGKEQASLRSLLNFPNGEKSILAL